MNPSSTSTTPTPPQPEVISDWEPEPKDFQQEDTPGPTESGPTAWVAGPKVEDALGHWSKLYENFQTSALDYYERLKEALARRRIPGFRLKRVNFSEGGVGEARREYLRVERGDVRMDICAAPFGTGFFFSWWLAGRPRSRWYFVVAGICIVGALLTRTDPYQRLARDLMRSAIFGQNGPLATLVFGLPFLLLIIAGLVLLVPLFRRLFRRFTYYKADTTLMFRMAVHSAVTETIDGIATAKGLRALTDEEKKPIMRDFFRR